MQGEKPSRTAYIACLALLELSKDKQWKHLVSPEAARYSQYFIDECRKTSPINMAFAVSFATGRIILNSIPGKGKIRDAASLIGEEKNLLHYGLRKLAIEETVKRTIKSQGIRTGAKQVIIVGGGFDSLALRLHKKYPRVQFFEIDHPATQAVKLKALQDRGIAWGKNLYFVACDLSKTPLSDTLRQHPSYDISKPSISVAEGLTMYLRPEEVSSMFTELRDSAPLGSQIVFSAIGSLKLEGMRRMEDYVRAVSGERFKFAIPLSEIPGFLQKLGFELRGYSSSLDLEEVIRPHRRTPLRQRGDAIENYFVARSIDHLVEAPGIRNVPSVPFVLPANNTPDRR